jgi:hypothetical protein
VQQKRQRIRHGHQHAHPGTGFRISRLEVSSSFDVNVSFGDKENVTLRVDD